LKPTRLRASLTGVALVPVLVWTLFPIYWITTASFKTELALYARPPQWLFTPILDNYTRVLTNIPFFQYLKNSLVIAIGTTLGSLVLGTLAGYGFARFHFRASEAVRFLVLVTRMAPRMVLVVPYYLMMQRLGLLDTYTGLLVAYVSFALPFSIWLLIGFFVDVPLDVEEAAMIDGCSRLGSVVRVILPLSIAGMLTVAIFAFTLSMQDFIYSLTFVSSSSEKVINIGVVTELIRGDVFFWGSIMAAALLVGLPVAILYNFFLDKFIQGITGGVGK
jgi:multiple sugar transport system permease protein